MGGVLRWQTHQSKELQHSVQLPRTQVQEGQFLQSRTCREPGEETECPAQDRQVRCVSIKNRRPILKIITSVMDTKTAYTRTFMTLLEQPIHEESVKTNYYTWWQNVRESYQARSLRLTKQGLETVEKLEIKTYMIKFPDKIIFTPQTYLWLDEFVDCPYFVDKKSIVVTMERMALQLMMFAGDITKYGLARAMSKADESKS